MPDPIQRISCPNCGFENPAIRRYCQDCGAPLRPGTTGPSAEGRTSPPHPWETAGSAGSKSEPKTVREHLSAVTSATIAIVGTGIRIAVLAAFAALLVVMLLPPRDIPAGKSMNADEVAHFRNLLLSTSSGVNRSPVDFSWTAINAYLSGLLINAPRSEEGWARAEFVRAFIVADDEMFTVFIEQKYLGLSYFLGVTYRPVIRARGAELRVTGGSIGRLRVPAAVTRLFGRSIESLANPLVYELSILRNVETVTITPESAALLFPPTGR